MEDEIGKRNWSKCCIFTDVTTSRNVLFTNGVMSQDVLNGLVEKHKYPVLEAVTLRIEELLKQETSGMNVDVDLDIQLTISLLPLHLQKLCLKKITIRPEHLLRSAAVDDIGHIIRDVMIQKSNNDVLFKLYQYTMPFIKHNRLNFPPRRFVSKSLLKHLLQIVALSCLGLHTHQSKKPVWHVRRQLFILFNSLTTDGSFSDLYVFFNHHNYLVRLALMENFVHFTSQCMTVEMDFMRAMSSTGFSHNKVLRLVSYITDNFRTSALQNETLDWELVEQKAQVAIERCNRTCKSHPMPSLRHLSSVHNCLVGDKDHKILHNIMTMPVVSKPTLLQAMTNCDMITMALRWKLQNNVQKYPLPLQMQNQQFSHVMAKSQRVGASTTVYRSLLYVCMCCCQQYPSIANNMRMDFLHKPLCVHCNSNSNILITDTLGHLVRVFRQYYYFCTICDRVHLWQGKGYELFACSFQPRAPARKHCVVCWRINMLSNHNCFDKKLGVMQNFFLCAKHCPAAIQCAYAYDLTSLRRLIAHIQR